MENRPKKKFWEKVLRMFVIYLFVIPVVFFIFDSKQASANFRKDAFMFILKMIGIALAISLLINLWFKEDKKLRNW
jgi:hypothetical protein